VGPIFTGLGFNYYGPIDGHDFEAMLHELPEVFARRGPTLVHVRTVKGSGYDPAKAEPERFHRTPAFDLATGKASAPPPPPGTQASFSQAFADALCEQAAADDRVVAITAAMRAGTGLKQFQEQFGDRMYDVGIAEQHAVTMAAGLATGGLRPVVAIYSTFFQRALDQVTHDVALQQLPVFFVLDRAGLVGTDGPTHHGLFDLAYLRAIPGVSLMAPKDNAEVAAMVHAAFAHNEIEGAQGPIFMRLPRDRGPAPREETAECPPIEWGKAEVLRSGDDVTLAAIGSLVVPALEAADALEAAGVSCTVINGRFVKPIDGQCIADHAARTRRVVTIEESQTAAGFGSAVLEALADRDVRGVAVRRLGVPDQFIETAERDEQLAMVGLTPADIVKRTQAFLRDEPDPVCEIVAAYAQDSSRRLT
ncbi:MAG: transketolase C-terminal domain-containing protein, partial [Planctomycetota bacterium]|jgi:1-deoxy-D-xylulose-5-phosphate synthase